MDDHFQVTQWAIAVCIAIGIGALLGLRGGALLSVGGALVRLLVASVALPDTRLTIIRLFLNSAPALDAATQDAATEVIRYKLAITIEVDGVERTASSVQDLAFQLNPQFLKGIRQLIVSSGHGGAPLTKSDFIKEHFRA